MVGEDFGAELLLEETDTILKAFSGGGSGAGG